MLVKVGIIDTFACYVDVYMLKCKMSTQINLGFEGKRNKLDKCYDKLDLFVF